MGKTGRPRKLSEAHEAKIRKAVRLRKRLLMKIKTHLSDAALAAQYGVSNSTVKLVSKDDGREARKRRLTQSVEDLS